MRFATPEEQPFVSVCLLTYNHQRWIETAIESILAQETDFPCEFIIAEDCSTDRTRDIIKAYAERYPIKLLLQEKNKGMMPNWRDLMNAPTGKYVAYMEGDDSWIDPLKLQKQADLLEADNSLVLCYANAKIYDTKNPDMVVFFEDGKKPRQVLDRYDTVVACPAPSCTLFFRNVMKPVQEWTLPVRTGDHLMIALVCKYGSVYYMDEYFGLYNHDYTGASRVIGQEHYLTDDFLPWMKLYEHYDHDPLMWDAVVQKGYINIDKLFHRGWPGKARATFWKWPFRRVWAVKRHRKSVTKMAIKLHTPFFIPLQKLYKKLKASAIVSGLPFWLNLLQDENLRVLNWAWLS